MTASIIARAQLRVLQKVYAHRWEGNPTNETGARLSAHRRRQVQRGQASVQELGPKGLPRLVEDAHLDRV